MKHARLAPALAVVTALAVGGAHADSPQITNLLTSHGFEDQTDLEFVNTNPEAGVVELSTDKAHGGSSSLHMSYDGESMGDIFAKWTGYQTGFDAGQSHDGYITTFQLYPISGSQLFRGSMTMDGPNHIGITIYGASPGGYAQTDIVVGLMDSENEGFAALGVMHDHYTNTEARYQRVAEVPLDAWTRITVYRKPSSETENPVELWAGNTFAGAYPDWGGDSTIAHMGWLGNPSSLGGSGEYYLDDMQFGTGIAGTACNPGDADGDGDVDDDDLSLLLANWGADTDCAHGEFSDVAPVNDDDLSLLLANWTGPLSAAIPEPATIALLVLAAPALWRRRRKG